MPTLWTHKQKFPAMPTLTCRALYNRSLSGWAMTASLFNIISTLLGINTGHLYPWSNFLSNSVQGRQSPLSVPRQPPLVYLWDQRALTSQGVGIVLLISQSPEGISRMFDTQMVHVDNLACLSPSQMRVSVLVHKKAVDRTGVVSSRMLLLRRG